MPYYKRVCLGTLTTKGILVPENEVVASIKDFNKPNYVSVFKYNEEQYKRFKESGSVSGIDDVVTDTLVWDFDSIDDLAAAKRDTEALLTRLQKEIDPKNIQVFFSGNKGFTVQVFLDRNITPQEQRIVCVDRFGKDLQTLDTQIYNASRILRCPWSKHEKGLYKIPLDVKQFSKLKTTEIKNMASDLSLVPELPDAGIQPYKSEWAPVQEKKKKTKSVSLADKPSTWRSCKWNILQGNFGSEPGERHHALLVLAATCRSMGYDKETTYYLCKSALKKQAEVTGRDEFSKDELWNNIIEQTVFTDKWNGGAYSCKTDPWLKGYCASLGEHKCKDTEDRKVTMPITEAYSHFKDYAENIDALTIKTGIEPLDENVRLTIGMLVGLVAPAGAGKTSLAIQMLNSMSKAGTQCIFFSYDMYHSLVFQKLVQRHFGISSEEIFERFKKNDVSFKEMVVKKLKQEYENVEFCFETGQSIEDMVKTIESVQEKTGKKVRFVVVDYNELVISDKSDSTAASAHTIQSLRAIASLYNTCVLTLLQPNKLNANPAEEVSTYQAAKGSSAIAQAVSVMLGVNRPGYDPRNPEDDKYLTIRCLKNRMGNLFSLDLYWKGLTGEVRGMTEDEMTRFKALMAKKAEEKLAQATSQWS